MRNPFTLCESKLRAWLSHRPKLYGVIVGIGVVLFWRGVWHTADMIHEVVNHYQNNLTIDLIGHPWWDGPVSFVVGSLVLLLSGAFTSSFIGNELILSGLRGEKKLNQKEEHELESEAHAIAQIRVTLKNVSLKLDALEDKLKQHHEENL